MMCSFILIFSINFSIVAQPCQDGLTISVFSDLVSPNTAIPYGTPIVLTTSVYNGNATPRTVNSLQTILGSQFDVLCAGDYNYNGSIAQRSSFTIQPGVTVESRITLIYRLFAYNESPDPTTRSVRSTITAGGNTCRSSILAIPARFSTATPLGVPGQTTTVNSFPGGALGSLIIRGNVILNFDHIVEPVGNGAGAIFPFIYMDEDARLIIPSGRTLTLKGARVFGIRSMWNSIIVESGGTLITSFGSDGLNTITKKTSIKDGMRAIEARSGSTIDVSATDFEDNIIGIFVPPATTSILNSVNFVSPFMGCDFNGTGQLRPVPTSTLNCNTNKINGYPFAGMDINDLGTLLTVSNPQANIVKTRFRSMSVGINASRARLFVNQARFENLSKTYSGFDGLGIYIRNPNSLLLVAGDPNPSATALDFSNCTQAIVYENFGLNNLAQINSLHIDNTADPIGVGIRAVNCNLNESYIYANRIRAKTGIISAWNRFDATHVGEIYNNFIEPTDPTNPTSSFGIVSYDNATTGSWNVFNNQIDVQNAQFGMGFYSGTGARITNNNIMLEPNSHVNACGLFANGSSNLNVSCNDISGAGLGGGAYRSGIYISNGTNASYTCNNVGATEVGFNITGEMRPFAMSANRFNNHKVGVVLNDATFIGIQTLKGNKWQGPFVRWGAEHNDPIPNNVLQSQFLLGSPNTPITPTFNSVAPNWFQLIGGTDATCTSLNACPNGNPAGRVAASSPPDNSAFYRSAASNERMQTQYADEMKWTAQRNAYGRLMDNPSEQNSREITTFVGNMRNTSTGQLYQVEKSAKDIQNIGQEFNDVLLQNTTSIKTLAMEIADLDAKIFTTKGAEQAIFIAQKKAKNAIIHRLSTENAPRHASIENRRKQQVQQLMRDNDRISTRLQPEINEKEVNRVYLETVAQGKMELNREQSVTMRQIAYQCPSQGGNAVFAARSLYSLVEKVNFDDLALCNARSASIQGLVTKRTETTYKISPNPATDVLSVSQLSDKAEAGEWLIFDTAGKLLLTKKVGENEIESSINIQRLSEGIYFVSFSVNGQKRSTQKLIKIKSN